MYAHYGWLFLATDLERQGTAFNIGMQVLLVTLLIGVGLASKSAFMLAVCCLLSLYSLLIIGCETWWLVAPWQSVAGENRCSTRLHAPLGILGLIVGLLLLGAMVKKRG